MPLPEHIAIIMDGNGRWAKQRNLPRFQGHLEGVKRVEEIVEEANKLGIKAMTLYTFSTENWNRPQDEVSILMSTISGVLDKKTDKLSSANIKLQFIGKREGIPQEVRRSIDAAMEKTKDNTGLVLNVAFNYGSRLEILSAVKQIAQKVAANELAVEDINEQVFSDFLYTKGLPDPDLLIRTSGERRISNFLLWQLSYSEFYFTDRYWPDFTAAELHKAIEDFKSRDRRFGKVTASRN